MKCFECGRIFDKRPIHVQHGEDHSLFCSLECVIAHCVGRIRQRIAYQNRRARALTRQSASGALGVHSHSNRRWHS